MTPPNTSTDLPHFALRPLAFIAAVKLAVHLAVNFSGGYGYFIDELYYLACARHLDWSYVDHPGLSIWLLAANRAFLGEGLLAMRLLPAIAGAGLVLLSGAMAREFGGSARAQVLTAVAVLIAPVTLVTDSFYSMNAFEPLFWVLAALTLVRLLRTGNTSLWLLVGMVVGLGTQNKFGMAFFTCAVITGLLLTRSLKFLAQLNVWAGAAIALALIMPVLFWQNAHDWATLEFMQNARTMKNASGSFGDFLFAQLFLQNPIAAPLWLLGLSALLLHPHLRAYRFFVIAYVLLFSLFWLQGGKAYYLTPTYPILLAAGAVVLTEWIARRRLPLVYPAALAMLLTGGVLLAPLGLPLLAPADFLVYTRTLGIESPKMERGPEPLLPQYFADRFGWEDLVHDVERAFQMLTAEDRRNAVVYTEMYAEAAAVDLFGPKAGLPAAISGHNNYWLWGVRGYSGEIVIAIGGDAEDYIGAYDSVRQALIHDGGMYVTRRRQGLPIWLLKAPKQQLRNIWAKTKAYH